MFEYNFKNIFIGQIKQLLNSFNLPQCKILVEGKPITIFEGSTYIVKDSLLLAKYTKKFNSYVYDENDFMFLDAYDVNKSLFNLTKTLPIRNNQYDTETHEQLGNYLRFQRDYFNIDLMSMYNCLTTDLAYNLNIKTSKINFDSSDSAYKIYVVPIKLWNKYAIAIDCATSVEVVAGFYKGRNQLSSTNSNNLTTLYTNSYRKLSGLQLNRPIVYDNLLKYITSDSASTDTIKSWYNKESDLKLFIKVPYTNKSSIVVLELNSDVELDINNVTNTISPNNTFLSNYKLKYRKLIVNYKDVDSVPNSIFNSNLQLLEKNDCTQHPFADRLIEYIIKNAITPIDNYSLNIERVETNLIKKKVLDTYTPHMEYTDTLRKLIYLKSMEKEMLDNYFDVIGYVDKDVEDVVVGTSDMTSTLKGGL